MQSMYRTACRSFISVIVALLATAVVATAASVAVAAPDANEAVAHPFEGVRHVRWEREGTEPQVAHIVAIALDTPGIRFKTTEPNGPDAPRDTWCETTYDFVKRVGAQIGINANYFILDNENHTELLGLAVSQGTVVSPWDNGGMRFALNITKENTAVFVERPENGAGGTATTPTTTLYNAVSGRPMLIRDGDILVKEGGDRHPRTGVGLTADNQLLLLVVDGRQPTHSVGMTFHEMATLFQAYDATDALALDGGGSTTLVFANPDPEVVNVPMPTTLPVDVTLGPPGIERRNGNNLAVFVRAKDATE